MSITSLLIFFVATTLFVAIRFYPLWKNRRRGCDAYYFLQCAKVLRETMRLPITLPPKYLAEPREQWYPPLFPLLLSLFPTDFLHTKHWTLNHIFDLFVGVIIYISTRSYVGDYGAAVLLILYALQTSLIHEFSTLTSRPIGHLIQLGILFSCYAYTIENEWYYGIAAIIFLVMLVYTHKLSLQLLWFLFPFLAITTGHWAWLGIFVGGYAFAFLLKPEYFFKIQRAHIDIVQFWHREWPFLAAHPVYQSPIYGMKSGFRSTSYYDSKAIKLPFNFLKTVLQINIFAVFLILGIILPLEESPLAHFFLWWAIGIYLWVMATHFIPHLRCLGLAQQYVKYSYVPVLGFAAIYTISTESPWVWLLALTCAALTIRWYIISAQSLRGEAEMLKENQVTALVEWIDLQQTPRIMVLPYHLADEIAYRSKAEVLWGTHGYGFEQVRPFFPILRESLESILKSHAISHLIIDTTYVSAEMLKLTCMEATKHIGQFLIFEPSHSLGEIK